MIEIRKLLKKKANGRYMSVTLQYRYITPACDASGALSAHGSQWSEWQDVKDIDAETGEEFIPLNKRKEEGEGDVDPELHD